MRGLRGWRGAGVGLAVLAAGASCVGAAIGSTHSTPVTVQTYTTPGTYAWTVPSGVHKVTFVVYGGGGGPVLGAGGVLLAGGGAGGEAKAAVRTTPGKVFEVVVGGGGATITPSTTTDPAGGFNGGGSGSAPTGNQAGIGAGGGASDVRLDASTGHGCATQVPPQCTLWERIIVAGGGGGGIATTDGNFVAFGGDGGGVVGEDGQTQGPVTAATGGTQTGGGGLFGSAGGSGGDFGGGGGWFGGGRAGYFSATTMTSGAGGSGYISPLALNGSFPTPNRFGNGEVIIQVP